MFWFGTIRISGAPPQSDQQVGSETQVSFPLASGENKVEQESPTLVFLRATIKKVHLRDAQSEDRKSFRPPFLLPWLSSRRRILLRRWTTQFLGFEEDLEEAELDPETLEEMEDLQGGIKQEGK